MSFSYIEKQLSKLGIQYLNLTVWDFNKDAIKFYSTLGMTPQRHIYIKKYINSPTTKAPAIYHSRCFSYTYQHNLIFNLNLSKNIYLCYEI
ncbi:hypothetical protein [Pectinatus brassicae]|uniref:hypothetical protein n=1 Tax=Pectinatus brassicae TaxID=862415 RepID=UPI0035D404BA